MLLSALILGLLGSLHCLGMCGPIAFMLPVDRSNKLKMMGQIIIYHSGRLISYGIMGMAFGFVGKQLYLFGMQQKLSIIIGVLMIVLVVLPLTLAKQVSLLKPWYSFLSWIKSKLGSSLKKRTADTFLTIGLLNGFLPCGLVYMALLGAIAFGNPFEGGLYMLIFGLGTVPLMTSAVYFSGFLNNNIKKQLQKAIPVFVILIGVLFILRGLGLGIPYISPSEPAMIDMATGSMECH